KNDTLMTHKTKQAFTSDAGIVLRPPAIAGADTEVAMQNPVRARCALAERAPLPSIGRPALKES
ncbi:MAG TPA: hypothetical protein VFH41_07215, partial [Bradyrhizobium sp.]|nr:hypothetical protein [Bradyrhizobium sp.]